MGGVDIRIVVAVSNVSVSRPSRRIFWLSQFSLDTVTPSHLCVETLNISVSFRSRHSHRASEFKLIT